MVVRRKMSTGLRCSLKHGAPTVLNNQAKAHFKYSKVAGVYAMQTFQGWSIPFSSMYVLKRTGILHFCFDGPRPLA